MRLLSLDIETVCNVATCKWFGKGKQCSDGHALIPHLARITCVGIWDGETGKVLRAPDSLNLAKMTKAYLDEQGEYSLCGQGFKFDLKFLNYHGAGIPLDRWAHDSQILAHTSITKIPQHWLDAYEEQRKARKKRGEEEGRSAKQHSLKTLAPYFLGVEPFWETEDMDNDQYVLKDAKYSYDLVKFFLPIIEAEGLSKFYFDHAMPWAKMLLEAELRGIRIDLRLLQEKKLEAKVRAETLKQLLDAKWAPAYEAYKAVQWADEVKAIGERYKKLLDKNLAKFRENPKPKKGVTVESLMDKNEKLRIAAMNKLNPEAFEPFNLDSPAQMAWLLRDYFHLNIINFEGKESTGEEVLQKLAGEGREDIKLFLEYREQRKLATAFYPSYEELQDEGIIRCSFNSTGTVTGRLSSSGPNLQQVPGDLHSLFIARPGYKLVTRDASYIEPRLIAYFTEDPKLVDLILRDGDFHGANAKIFCDLKCEEKEVKAKHKKERDLAKTVGLSLLYGSGANKLHQIATKQGYDWTINHCRHLVQQFKKHYQHVYNWKQQLDSDALQRPIASLFGRKRYFENPDDIYMQAFNGGVIQPSASDLILDGACKAMAAFKEHQVDAHVLLFVHDEVVFEVPEDRVAECEEIIERNMTDFPLPTQYGNIPLKVEGKTGDVWAK